MPPRSPCVLIVEDDPNDLFFLTRAIARVGLDCITHVAGDGEAAIDYLSGRGRYENRDVFPIPTLILLDLKLPLMGGHDVLRWLRGQPVLRRIPVLVLTSSSHPTDVADALDAGANAYIIKPGGIEEFAECVRSIGAFWLGCHLRTATESPTPSRA